MKRQGITLPFIAHAAKKFWDSQQECRFICYSGTDGLSVLQACVFAQMYADSLKPKKRQRIKTKRARRKTA